MKCIPLLALWVAVSFVPVMSAEDEGRGEKPHARKNASSAKPAQAVAKQPQAIAPGQHRYHNPQFTTQAPASIRMQRKQAGYNSDIGVVPHSGRPVISKPTISQPLPPVVNPNISPVLTPNEPRIDADAGRKGGSRNAAGWNRNWSKRGEGNRVWNGTSGTWQGQHRSGKANHHWDGQTGEHHGDFDHHKNWDRHHRNRSWWRSHYTRFAVFGGGYYYWNSGYWYPAYGYDPYFSNYVYDAPIYSYNDLEPGAVIASVQAELQRRGYDPGSVDGEYGPATREALLAYQEDNGLPVTGEIDQATLESLGLE